MIPHVPRYPDGVNRAVVSYAGPPRWQIGELLAKQRANHAGMLAKAKVFRERGELGHAVRYLGYARLARFQIRTLLASRHALNTMWAEQLWYPYPEYEARRAALAEAGVLHPNQY